MNTTTTTTPTPTTPKLLLTTREAAAALSISDRTLWTLTQAGDVKCVRIGKSVRYSPADLEAFIARAREQEE